MKNIFKRFLAVVLVFAMLLGCMTASFAAGETIEWNLYGVDEEDEYWITYPWLGELSSGETKAGKDITDYDDIESVTYGFTAESDGFYRFTLGDLTYFYNNVIYFSEKIVDGKAYGMITDWEFYQIGDDKIDFYVYLPAGETAILLQCQEELTISFEYLGKITDIVYDEESLTGLLGSDFCSELDYSYGYGFKGEVFFDSGNSMKLEGLSFDFDKRLVKGENQVTFDLFGFEKEVTLIAVEHRDIITKLEAINLEDDLFVTEHYNGDLSVNDVGEAELKITYADGREEIVDFDEGYAVITLPNGRTYSIGVDFNRETLEAELYFEYELYETYDFEVKTASFEENMAELGRENAEWLAQAETDMNWRLDHFETAGSLSEKVSLIFWIPFLYTNAFFQIFCNVVELVEYYI